MDSVVLAGGRCPDDLRAATGCEFRGDLPFGDRRMVEIVVDAIDEMFGGENRIIVVGAHVDGRECLPPGDSFLGSLKSGVDSASTERVLIATADIPFITVGALRHFVENSVRHAMLNWPVVPVEACQRLFPTMRRTTIKTREGRFTGGNLGLIDRSRFNKVYPVIETAYRLRKKPLRLASMVGIGTLLRLIIGQALPSTLPISALESAVGRLLGDRVQSVVSPFAEVGTDVDSLEQYQAATETLRAH